MPLVALRIKFGSAFSVYALEENRSCPFIDFLESNEIEAARVQGYLDRIKEHGLITNPEQSKKLENGISYFRTRGGARVFYFTDIDRVLVCANGYIKKKDKLDPSEIRRAEIWRRKYFNAKQSNTL